MYKQSLFASSKTVAPIYTLIFVYERKPFFVSEFWVFHFQECLALIFFFCPLPLAFCLADAAVFALLFRSLNHVAFSLSLSQLQLHLLMCLLAKAMID